jgi:hypothetical protein
MSRAVTLALALALATALLAAACVAADAPVLTAGPTLRSCDEVQMRQFDLQACEFDGVCTWSDAADPNGAACCTYFAVCNEGRLLVESMCPMECTDCPTGTVPLRQNGCATCTCAPPSQCDDLDAMACDPSLTCYRGQVCADATMPGQLDGCANVCAAPGCAEPAPLGCRMDCPMELGCATCMATACVCDAGVWSCSPVCSDVVGPCFLP